MSNDKDQRPRVALAFGAALRAVRLEDTPEAWAQRTEAVMSLDALSVPLSMMEEVAVQANALGDMVSREFARIADRCVMRPALDPVVRSP